MQCSQIFYLKFITKMRFKPFNFFKSSPMITISSTYTIIVVVPFNVHLMNKVWLACDCLYPTFFKLPLNLSNQALGDCLNPYKAFFNLHTFLSLPGILKPGEASYIPPHVNHHEETRSSHLATKVAIPY